MKVSAKHDVFKKLKNKSRIGMLYVRHADNNHCVNETQYLLKEMQELRSFTFNKDTLKTHHLLSPYNALKEHIQKTPNQFHSSVEVLLTKVIAKRSVVTTNVAENIARYLSLKHVIPVLVEDGDKIVGDVVFSVGTGHERLSAIKRSKKGEIICFDGADKNKVIWTGLGTYKNSRTRVSSRSESLVFQIIVLSSISEDKFKEIMNEAQDLLRTFTKGSVKRLVLNAKKLKGTV